MIISQLIFLDSLSEKKLSKQEKLFFHKYNLVVALLKIIAEKNDLYALYKDELDLANIIKIADTATCRALNRLMQQMEECVGSEALRYKTIFCELHNAISGPLSVQLSDNVKNKNNNLGIYIEYFQSKMHDVDHWLGKNNNYLIDLSPLYATAYNVTVGMLGVVWSGMWGVGKAIYTHLPTFPVRSSQPEIVHPKHEIKFKQLLPLWPFPVSSLKNLEDKNLINYWNDFAVPIINDIHVYERALKSKEIKKHTDNVRNSPVGSRACRGAYESIKRLMSDMNALNTLDYLRLKLAGVLEDDQKTLRDVKIIIRSVHANNNLPKKIQEFEAFIKSIQFRGALAGLSAKELTVLSKTITILETLLVIRENSQELNTEIKQQRKNLSGLKNLININMLAMLSDNPTIKIMEKFAYYVSGDTLSFTKIYETEKLTDISSPSPLLDDEKKISYKDYFIEQLKEWKPASGALTKSQQEKYNKFTQSIGIINNIYNWGESVALTLNHHALKTLQDVQTWVAPDPELAIFTRTRDRMVNELEALEKTLQLYLDNKDGNKSPDVLLNIVNNLGEQSIVYINIKFHNKQNIEQFLIELRLKIDDYKNRWQKKELRKMYHAFNFYLRGQTQFKNNILNKAIHSTQVDIDTYLDFFNVLIDNENKSTLIYHEPLKPFKSIIENNIKFEDTYSALNQASVLPINAFGEPNIKKIHYFIMAAILAEKKQALTDNKIINKNTQDNMDKLIKLVYEFNMKDKKNIALFLKNPTLLDVSQALAIRRFLDVLNNQGKLNVQDSGFNRALCYLKEGLDNHLTLISPQHLFHYAGCGYDKKINKILTAEVASVKSLISEKSIEKSAKKDWEYIAKPVKAKEGSMPWLNNQFYEMIVELNNNSAMFKYVCRPLLEAAMLDFRLSVERENEQPKKKDMYKEKLYFIMDILFYLNKKFSFSELDTKKLLKSLEFFKNYSGLPKNDATEIFDKYKFDEEKFIEKRENAESIKIINLTSSCQSDFQNFLKKVYNCDSKQPRKTIKPSLALTHQFYDFCYKNERYKAINMLLNFSVPLSLPKNNKNMSPETQQGLATKIDDYLKPYSNDLVCNLIKDLLNDVVIGYYTESRGFKIRRSAQRYERIQCLFKDILQIVNGSLSNEEMIISIKSIILMAKNDVNKYHRDNEWHMFFKSSLDKKFEVFLNKIENKKI